MKTLLLVHGWGFEAGFWRELAQRLPDFRILAADLGFRAERHIPAAERPLVVGHSLGFAWALANVPQPWGGAVAINAFPRFTRTPDYVAGVAPRLIGRMIERFAEAPAQVAADFLARCGVETPELEGARFGPMGEALSWLAQCDERAALARLDCPFLALAGGRDPIVTEEMSKAAFAGRDLVILSEGGHLLPLTHPDWVAARIRGLATRMP